LAQVQSRQAIVQKGRTSVRSEVGKRFKNMQLRFSIILLFRWVRETQQPGKYSVWLANLRG
jgi:hypothetical protein